MIEKEKVFGIVLGVPEQEKLVKKLCFKDCGKIIVGGLSDPELGALAPCKEEKCPYEGKRLKFGKIATGEIVWLRRLEER